MTLKRILKITMRQMSQDYKRGSTALKKKYLDQSNAYEGVKYGVLGFEYLSDIYDFHDSVSSEAGESLYPQKSSDAIMEFNYYQDFSSL